MGIKKLKNWLYKKETITFFNSYAPFFLGLSALVISIVNIGFVRQQTKINTVLSQLQIEQAQPFFVVSTPLEQDTKDGFYGTEHLIVKNHGFSNITPKVSETTLFELTRYQIKGSDAVFICVNDYFFVSYLGSSDEHVIYHSTCPNNNREFYKLYMKALKDNSEEGTTYMLEKHILVQIDYSDLLNNNHTKFYINDKEVNEREFKMMLSKVHDKHYNLNELNYENLKELFDKKP